MEGLRLVLYVYLYDVLDPCKLRDSLTALVQRHNWHKLSARLRWEGSGFVYHISASFSVERPVLVYSHVVYGMSAAQHSVATKLPSRETTTTTTASSSSSPQIVGDPDDFRPLFYPEGGPTKHDHYLARDIPQLGLHVVSFSDKTVVTLYWPHTTMDAMGKRTLLDAWTLTLQGRADEVAVLEGDSHHDPLATLGTAPTEPYILASHVLSLPAMAVYAVRNIGNLLRTHENRMVRLPFAFIARLRAQAAADIAGMADHAGKPAFVSEGDILCAWWACLATKHLLPPNSHNSSSSSSSSSNKTVILNSAMSLRNSLAGDLFSTTAPGDRVNYVSNATSFVFTRLTLGALTTQPLGVTAAGIRCDLKTQRARPQIEAYAALWRASPGKLPPLVGDSGMHMLTFSNWKASLYETDLSAAIVGSSNSSSRRSGRPSYLQSNQFGLVLPNGFPIIGKDLDGDVWFSGYMNPAVWASIEAELSRI